MTQDEIIEFTKRSGLGMLLEIGGMDKCLEHFSKLVAQHEREACAKAVEESSLPDTYSQECLPEIANDIRARGQA
jgi:hypothetical protein